MKIGLTGGGTGGHFYPLIAVAEEIRDVAREQKLFDPKFYYFGPEPYNERLLFENDIEFVKIGAGKVRRYFSLKNIFGPFKILGGTLTALRKLFKLYPDVIFSKGGYTSVPVLIAARILSIPVVVHESDSKAGRANKWAGKFAERIAVSYPEAAQFFPKNRVAHTGQPIRKALLMAGGEAGGGHDYFKLDKNIPTIFVIGGSLGAQAINDVILDALERLVEKYQIIHQTGKTHFGEVSNTANFLLKRNQNKGRYRPMAFLNDTQMHMAASASNLIISRAGSQIFEIAAWGRPSIIIPIPESVSHDQRTNAFAYARSGAAEVIEQENLSDDILLSQIEVILENQQTYDKMRQATQAFTRKNASQVIAKEIIDIALEHQK